MSQHNLGVRDKIALGGDVGVVDPSGKAFDAAFRLGAIRDVGGHFGQLRALTPHDPTDERRERGQVPDDHACGLARIALYQRIPYGTIPAEVVTHRLLLLDWLHFPGSIRWGQPLKPPFYNGLKDCPVAKTLLAVMTSTWSMAAPPLWIRTPSKSMPPMVTAASQPITFCSQ